MPLSISLTMPTPTRHFIGNHSDAPELIVQWCQQRWPNALPSGLVFCVPTSLAMRRLRDALTRAYGCYHGIHFILPAGLINCFTNLATNTIATPTEQLCAWDAVFDWLATEDEESLVATWLFPGKRNWLKRPSSRYTVANRFITLRATLAEGLLDFAGVATHPQTQVLSERERYRWAALDALESRYRAILTKSNLIDPTDHQLNTLRNPIAQPLEGNPNWHLVVACIPDLMPALTRLFSHAPVCDILIQAQPDLAHAFTEAGIPDPAFWESTQLSIHDNSIVIKESPEDEAQAIEAFLAKTRKVDLSKLCLGVLNHEVIPPLTTIFDAHGLHLFEPDPIRLASQPPVRLLQILFQLTQEEKLELVAPLLSFPEIGTFLKTTYVKLRTDYNKLLETHFPTTLTEALTFTAETSSLYSLFKQIKSWTLTLQQNPYEGARQILSTLFGAITPDPVNDAYTFATFDALRQLFRELASIRLEHIQPSIALFNARLEQIHLHPIRGTTHGSYEGRLELLWSPAKQMVVSGLNEGIFPDTTFEDTFLPNQFRLALGLRSDASRLSRDAYLIEMLCQRFAPTDILLSCCKVNVRGDWLKPSRLFFRCTDKQRRDRTYQLFLKPTSKNTPTSADTAIQLTTPLENWTDTPPTITRLSASAIRTFITSPIEFWLKYALHLEQTEPLPEGISAAQFGNLIHESFERVVADETEMTDKSVEAIKIALQRHFCELFTKEYGDTSNLELLAVKQSGLTRLQRAAEIEASLRQEGWITKYVEADTKSADWEVTIPLETGNITLYGKIDRIDFNPTTNQWRIIDYKTARKGDAPNDTHYIQLKPKSKSKGSPIFKEWKDFQLPIYRLLMRKALQIPSSVPIQLCYFTLPSEGMPELLFFNDPVSEAHTLEGLQTVLAQIQTLSPEMLYRSQQTLNDATFATLITPLFERNDFDSTRN